jgi:iron complex outermembrane receptor protein
MNISVLDAVTIEERGIYRPEDYLRTLAGVSTPGGDQYFTIRGLNTSTAQTSAGTTNTFVNEIALGMTNLYDIDRIEVLRGPQGTLYGSNAVGGTIRYITNLPTLGEFEANVTAEYTNKNLADDSGYTVNGMVNIPLGDTMALRAVVTSAKDPGIYQNIATGRKDVGNQEDDEYRLMLRYNDGPWDVNLVYMVRDRFDFGQKEKGNADKPGTADVVEANCAYDGTEDGFWYGPLYGDVPTCNRLYGITGGDLSGYDPELAFFSFTDETFDSKTKVWSLDAEYDFGPVIAKLIYSDYSYEDFYVTDWSRIDTDDLLVDNLYYWGDSGTETTEVRFVSNYESALQWVFGYYSTAYADAGDRTSEWEVSTAEGVDYVQTYVMGFDSHECGTTGYPGDFDENGDPTGCYTPSLYKSPFGDLQYRGYGFDGGLLYGSYIYYSYAEETAIYGSLDYQIGNLALTFGFRAFEMSDGFKSSEYGIFYPGAGNGCDGNEPDGVTCAEENGTERDQRFKIAASYEVNDNLTVFAVSSAGYRPGGNNAALPFFCSNDPEAAGFRRRYTSDKAENTELGMKLRGSRFNLNATYFWIDWQDIQVDINPACGWTFTYNGGEAETNGLEVDIEFDVLSNLRLDVAASVMSAEISKDIESLGATAGDRLPNVAETQASIGLSYLFDLASMPGFARLDLNYYGDSYATFAMSKEDMSPSYSQANLNVGLELNDSTRIQFSVANLTDERTEAFRFSAESPEWRPRNYLQWIPPRTISLSVSKDF